MSLEGNLRAVIEERMNDKNFEVTNVFFIKDTMRIYFREVNQ